MKRAVFHLIRSMTPISLRKAIHHTGVYFGLGLERQHPYIHFPSVEGALRTLRRSGFNPRFCIDVGAYRGEWAQLFREEFPASKVLMIEAQESKRPILEQLAAAHPNHLSVETALLGSADGEIVRFSEMETGSSVFAETSACSRVTVEKPTTRLDTLVTRGHYPPVDFLKLDVQGYELEVLKGATQILGQATAVLMEASLIPINEGCPLIATVIAFMEAAGFRLFDFCSQIRRADGALWQTDLLFLRTTSPILPKASLNP